MIVVGSVATVIRKYPEFKRSISMLVKDSGLTYECSLLGN
jgi:hypothetical protein